MIEKAIGTPYYLAPEMCKEQSYNLKIDIWMLGCLAYELCNLQKPFYSDKVESLIKKIVEDEV